MMELKIMKPRTENAKGIIELNKQIRAISKETRKLLSKCEVLKKLMAEFLGLVFDKLVLDSVRPNYTRTSADTEFQTVRVLLGRIKAASRFFDRNSAPSISQPNKAKYNSFRSMLPSRTRIYVSRRAAERQLHNLASRYVILQAQCEGITETIKRFQEDNAALRQDIVVVRRSPELGYDMQDGQSIWERLASVDLLNSNQCRTATEASRNRMSSLSQRRMSFTSSVPFATKSFASGEYDSSQVNSIQRRDSTRSFRRRSGELYLNDCGSRENLFWSSGTSISLAQNSPFENNSSQASLTTNKRYSMYDASGKKMAAWE